MMNWTEVLIHTINVAAEAFGFCGVLYSVYSILSKEKLSFLPVYIPVWVVGIITGLIAAAYQPITMLITAFICLNIKKVRLLHNILSCITAIVVFMLLVAAINGILWLFVPIEQVSTLRHELFYNVYVAILFTVLSVAAIGIINIISRRILKTHSVQYIDDISGNKKLIYFIATTVIVWVALISTIWFLSLIDYGQLTYYAAIACVVTLTLAVFALFSIYTVMRIVAQKSNEMEIQKNKELTEVYKTEIQSMYDEIRDFKHDYMKIYSSMSVLLKENKIDELKDFFDREITPLQSNLVQEASIGPALTLIDDSIVQGVIYNYVIKAKNGGIDFHIDVRDKIPASEKISSLELSRILGIILDNAFEEAVKTEAKEVQFGIVSGVGTVYVVKNTYSETPDLSKIFDKSYSTKGTERGRGLAIVKGICDKYEEIDLSVKIQPNYFVCELMM